MAENDIELSVGIKIDEAQFNQEYQSKLKEISKATQTQITGAMDDISGSASKQWGPLPFAGMHDPNNGNTVATQAFIASLAHDLQGSGYSGLAYESALTNATYKSSMPDPMQRYHRMLAMGLMQEADLTHPDTALGRSIESNYELMSQPWARDFIQKGDKGSYVDFAGMREYAVEMGLGRWIDENGTTTADNFELISDELDDIEEKSNTSRKTFSEWNDTLKGVLGTLTAIGAVVGIAKTLEKVYKAGEAGTIAAGETLDKRRAFIGMSALDELKTKVASRSVGLGEDSIKNEIYSMSGNIEQYKLLGQGDALPPALLGIFNNLMSAEDPYEVYTKSADELYNKLKGADAQTRRRWLLLMNKAGLGSMSSLVGQFLSNPEYAQKYKTPSELFTLKSNPFYGAYEDAETMLPDLAQLNASIEASYSQMYKDWEKAFGKPFKEWWDKTLQNTVVPWFEKIISMLGLDQTPEQKKGSAAVVDLSMILMSSDRDKAILKAFNKKDASVVNVPGYRAQQGAIAGHADWGSWFGGVVENTGRGAQAAWTLYGQVASYTQEDINRISNPQQRAATQDVVNRIKKMREKLDKVGLAHFLENDTGESIDKYLLRAMQVGVYGKAADWEANFDSYINQILRLGLGGKTDDKIVALLEQIAANTEIKEAIKNNASFWEIIELQYGPTVANDWREKLTNR